MTAPDVVTVALLALAVLAELICVTGLLWMRSVFDQLHFSAASTAIAPACVAAACVVKGLSSIAGTVECITACTALFVLNPVLTSATGRAARNADFGGFEPQSHEWREQ